MGSEEQQRAVVTVTPSVVAAAAAASAAPQIQQLNVSDNSTMHIGPRFVNVTQNVHQDKVVKGRLLGLILEARAATDKRHLRCGVAVFICWALVVAGVLASYVAYVMLSNRSQRIDLDIKEPWYLRRADWTALPAFDIQFLKLPVRYALIGHSATETCTDRYNCTACMIKIQNDHQRKGWSDIGPNFFVGSKEGLVLEGRGANVHGAMVQGWNAKSQTIMFIGDYRMEHDRPYPAQMEHLAKLLDALVKAGTLHPEYVLLGHCQVVGHVEPPGVNLLKELQAFPHWDSRNITACQHWTEFESIRNNTTTEVANNKSSANP